MPAPSTHKERRYVDVVARWRDDGQVMPLAVCWPDGRTFQIDEVLGSPAANAFSSASEITLRYKVRVGGRVTNLFLEKSGGTRPALRWYVEALPGRPLWRFGRMQPRA